MKICPACKSKTGLRKIFYGMPMLDQDSSQPLIDESKYVLGGCCVYGDAPTTRCTECGWEGGLKNNSAYV